MRLKAIVFDIDGVLLRLTSGETQAYVGAFERCFGIIGVSEDWNSYKKRNDIEIAKEILAIHFGRAADRRDVEKVLGDYVEFLAAGLSAGRLAPEILPGAIETVLELAARPGLCLALATANTRAAAELRLSRAGLWPRFHCGGFAEDGEDKTAILHAVIAKCRDRSGRSILPEDVLFLGDQPSDARAARTNGTRFIGIAAGEAQRRSLRSAGAGSVIPRLSVHACLHRLTSSTGC